MAARIKSVMVTGGAQGLGEAIARRLARDGWAVTICDAQRTGAEVARSIAGEFIHADVTCASQVEAAVGAVAQKHGKVDALVNNAGVVGPQRPCAEVEVAEWKRIIDVNLHGAFYCMKYALAQMARQETGGSIVNLSSVVGFRGIVNTLPYIASKFAVRGMTQAAAVEYANKRIRVNAIAPTACETTMVRGHIESSPDPAYMRRAASAMNAIPALVQPEDVAAAAAFLLSDEARYITGHTLPVDAGALCRMAHDRDPLAVDAADT